MICSPRGISARFREVLIHAPAKVRLSISCWSLIVFEFQSTHPQRCDIREVDFLSSIPCFNPRTRKGATCVSTPNKVKSRVSIHAPAKVRRKWDYILTLIGSVSIHAPAKVRRIISIFENSKKKFQSTHPQRCDGYEKDEVTGYWSFNPRTRKGATKACDAYKIKSEFQSTHPQRCDLDGVTQNTPLASFNPRTRKGATSAATPRGADK